MKRDLRSMVELKEFLKNPSPNLKVPVYDLNKEGRDIVVHTPKKEKMTLTKLADMMNARIDSLEHNVNTRIDSLEHSINARLDYIVSANSLKDLPKSKSK